MFTPPRYLSATSRTFSSPIPCSVIIPGRVLCFVVGGINLPPACTGTAPSKLFSTSSNRNCFFCFIVRRIKPFPGSNFSQASKALSRRLFRIIPKSNTGISPPYRKSESNRIPAFSALRHLSLMMTSITAFPVTYLYSSSCMVSSILRTYSSISPYSPAPARPLMFAMWFFISCRTLRMLP